MSKRILIALIVMMMASVHPSSLTFAQVRDTPPEGERQSDEEFLDELIDDEELDEELEEERDTSGFSLKEAGFDIKSIDPDTNLPTLNLDNVDDPLQVVDSILLRYIINPIFFLAGGVAVLVIMYSAFRIVVSRGEEEGLTAAKNTLIWAAAGLALVLLAYTLVGNLARIILQQL